MNRLPLLVVLSSLMIVMNGPVPMANAQAPGDTAPGDTANGFAPQSTFKANEITNFNATLKGMRGGLVVVEKEDGTEAFVAPPDLISSFQFVAKATPAFLQRGMLMRFTANFGPGGVPLGPVDKVTLFQPVDQRSLQGHAKQQFTPGVYPDAKPGDRNQAMTGKITIVGRFMGLSPGMLAVQAGKVPVRVPVTDDTQLEVRYNNLLLAQEGDPVTVSGFYQPPNENQVKADRVTITTDRVYGEYQPEAKKKSRRKRGDDQGDKAEANKPDEPKLDDEQEKNDEV